MKILLKIENYEKGIIIERLNRFVVKGKIKNRYVLAHLNNTGRLEDFVKKGRIGLFLPINADYADSTQSAPTKLKFRLSMIKESKNIYSVIDTQLQMKCFEIALEKGYISWLKGAKILKRNFRINHSLIDYLIEHKNKKYLLEIKSAVMKYKNFAMYPDCPSVRGQKHIRELIDIQSARITDRINYPNKLSESSNRIIITRIKDRIESTRITRPNRIPEWETE
jgi:sugar fermentation stimulation protein A